MLNVCGVAGCWVFWYIKQMPRVFSRDCLTSRRPRAWTSRLQQQHHVRQNIAFQATSMRARFCGSKSHPLACACFEVNNWVMHLSCHRAFATRGPVMTDNGAPRIDAYVAFVYMLLSKIGVTNKVQKMSVLVTSKSKGAKKITFCCNIQEYNAPAFSIHGSCSLNLRT